MRLVVSRNRADICVAGDVSVVYLPAIGAGSSRNFSKSRHPFGCAGQSASKDQLATAAAIVVFWPAAFFVGGDKQTAAELANMKGQMVAIEQASIAKKCNIQFQGKPTGT